MGVRTHPSWVCPWTPASPAHGSEKPRGAVAPVGPGVLVGHMHTQVHTHITHITYTSHHSDPAEEHRGPHMGQRHQGLQWS